MTLQPQLTRGGNGEPKLPEYRHATVVPLPWVDQMLNPFSWRVGHWAMFGVMLTLAADIIAVLYLFNFFGVARQFELQMWLIIAGVVGFASLTAALYAIFFRSGRGSGIVALILGLPIAGPPAWLVLNTVLQFFLNGGTLPDAPIDW